MQNVYSHFQERIPLKSSSFSVPNPNRYRDGIERQFYFKYLHVAPEYFSMLATENDLEDEITNPIPTEHTFYFEFRYTNDFYGSEGQMTLSSEIGTFNLHSLMQGINKWVDDSKNAALTYPPLVVDWVHPDLNKFNNSDDIAQYLVNNVDNYYTTPPIGAGHVPTEEGMPVEFTAVTRANVLARDALKIPGVNSFPFPTVENKFINSRVRIIIAPNTRVSFSNEKLLHHLGFRPVNHGPRGAKNRFHMVNKSLDSRKVIIAQTHPDNTSITIDTISHLYIMSYEKIVKIAKPFSSTKAIESKRPMIEAEFENFFKNITLDFNLGFIFQYNSVRRNYIIDVPDNSTIKTIITLSPGLQKLMGFDSPITKINKNSTNVDTKVHDVGKYLQLCKILTQDTCDVIVTLADVPSILHRGQPEQIMAALVPKDDILKNVKNVAPRVSFPVNDKFIKFKVYRHSETGSGKMINLSWPIECYVYGMLCGEPIKPV